jgi:hypothetical protein
MDDVRAMYKQNLFSLKELQECLESISPELIRFPSLDPDVIRNRVEGFVEGSEDNLTEEES